MATIEDRLPSETVLVDGIVCAPAVIRSRRSATVDLAIVIVVFAAGSLSVPFVNPILRQGHSLAMAFAAAAFQFLLEGLN